MSEGSLSAAVAKAVASVRLTAQATKQVPDGRFGDGPSQIKRLRDRHHQTARLVAAGLPPEQICKVMGMTERQLALLTEQTPAFIELVAQYRPRALSMAAAIDAYADLLEGNMIAAEQILRDKLMEEGDEMSPSVLNKLAIDRADRLGYGRQNLNVNVNIDLRGRMETLRRKRHREAAPVGTGEQEGASSAVSAPRSAPLLELKAEPATSTASPHPVAEAPSAQPPEVNLDYYGRVHNPPRHPPILRRV